MWFNCLRYLRDRHGLIVHITMHIVYILINYIIYFLYLLIKYSKSNIELIMNKIRNALQAQYKDFIGKYLDKLIINDNILVICHDTIR